MYSAWPTSSQFSTATLRRWALYIGVPLLALCYHSAIIEKKCFSPVLLRTDSSLHLSGPNDTTRHPQKMTDRLIWMDFITEIITKETTSVKSDTFSSIDFDGIVGDIGIDGFGGVIIANLHQQRSQERVSSRRHKSSRRHRSRRHRNNGSASASQEYGGASARQQRGSASGSYTQEGGDGQYEGSRSQEGAYGSQERRDEYHENPGSEERGSRSQEGDRYRQEDDRQQRNRSQEGDRYRQEDDGQQRNRSQEGDRYRQENVNGSQEGGMQQGRGLSDNHNWQMQQGGVRYIQDNGGLGANMNQFVEIPSTHYQGNNVYNPSNVDRFIHQGNGDMQHIHQAHGYNNQNNVNGVMHQGNGSIDPVRMYTRDEAVGGDNIILKPSSQQYGTVI